MEQIDKLVRLILPVILLCTLSGCGGGSTAIRYYLIDPVDYNNRPAAESNDVVIEIMDVHIPQYMERFNIVGRGSENQLFFSEYNQWGDNFRKNLLRTMAQNLTNLQGTRDIGTPINRTMSTPDFRIQIHINQFERNYDGYVKLDATWQVLDVGAGNDVFTHHAELMSNGTYTLDEYENIVASMKDLYGQLGQLISDSVSDRR